MMPRNERVLPESDYLTLRISCTADFCFYVWTRTVSKTSPYFDIVLFDTKLIVCIRQYAYAYVYVIRVIPRCMAYTFSNFFGYNRTVICCNR